MEEWISLNEYMRRYKVGYEVALQMVHNGEIECRKTSGGRYKIKVGGDTVPRKMYEDVLQELAEYKTIVRTMKTITNQVQT